MAEDKDETIYDEEGREEMVDESEISPEEEGFMSGYDEDYKEEEKEKEEDEASGKKDKDQEEE